MRDIYTRISLIFGLLLGTLFYTNAQTCTWIASGASGNWNNPANWSCGIVPPLASNVVFDGTSTADCIIDVSFQITRLTVDAGYTGTITNTTFDLTIDSSYTQSGGTFVGGTGDIELTGSWTLNNGTFISTSGTFTIQSGPFESLGGTFLNNSGRVYFKDLGSCAEIFNATTSDVFSTLIFDVSGFPSCGFSYDLNGSSIVVSDTLKSQGNSMLLINNGTISVKKDIHTTHGGGGSGTATILIDGTGDQSWRGPANDPCGRGMLGNIVINKAPTDTLYIYEHPTIINNYQYVSGVIKTVGTLCFQGNANLSGPSHTISDVEFMRNTITLDPGMVITSDSSCAIYQMPPIINNGEIHVKGDLISFCYLSSVGGGTSTIRINGTGTQRLYTNSFVSNSGFPNVSIEKSSSDTLEITRAYSPYHTYGPVRTPEHKYAGTCSDWTYVSGTITGDGIIAFSARNSSNTTNIYGSHNLPNISFHGSLLNNTLTTNITTGVIVTVDDSMFTDGAGRMDIDGGEAQVHGNIFLKGTGRTADGTATIRIVGTADQTFGSRIGFDQSRLPNIIIDKPSATLFLKDTVTITGNWTYLNGLVDAVTFPSVFAFTTTGKTIDGENGGYTHAFNEAVLLAGFDRRLLGGIAIEDRLHLLTSDLILNANKLTLNNSSTAALNYTTGKILSEDQPPGSYGSVDWKIGNAASGASYKFPFVSNTGDSIPFVFNVTTAGAGTGGSIEVATYRTDWTQFPNNRPLPTGVTNIDNILSIDNYQREVDRFWVVDALNYTTAPTSTMKFTYTDNEWSITNNSINESLLEVHRWLPGSSAWSLPTVGSSTQNTAQNYVTIPNQSAYTVFTLVDPNPPDLLISSSDTVICSGATIDFFDENVVTPTSSSWQFPGASPATSNMTDPTGITYTTPGTYDVILWATFSGGTIQDTFFDFITVVDNPTVVLDSQNVLCAGGGNAAIWATPTPSVVDTFLWSGGTPGVTPDTIVGLTTGSYTVTVVDTNGCTVSATASVSAPSPLVVTKDSTNVTCLGGANGKAWVTISGGTLNYSVSWSSGSTSGPINDTISGLIAGTYTATITDGNSCTETVTFVIEEPATSVSATVDTALVSCFGGSDGSAWATASGGTTPYSYSWSAGTPTNATGDTVTGLAAGSYTVTVSDSNSCSTIVSFTINEPTQLAATLDTNAVSCNGGSDGMAWATASGGTTGYTYVWSGGTPTNATGDTISGLTAGNYTVTVTDANSCSVVESIVVTEPTVIVLSLDSTEVNCFGDADGTAWVTATGGMGGFTYAWSGGTPTNATGDTIVGLTAGWYTVTVTDANSCTSVDSILVTEPAAAVAIARDGQGVTCFGGADGKAWVTPSGGTSPYTVVWSSGTTSGPIGDTISGLVGGNYYVTVTDDRGCWDSTTVVVIAPTAGITIVKDSVNVTCNGFTDGQAWFTMSGGTTPYFVTWSGGTPSGPFNDTISGLAAGWYFGTVSDDNGCTAVDSFNITEANAMILELDSTDVLCNGDNTGAAWATITGGTPGFTYVWNGGTPGATDDTIVNLLAGTYTVTVTDTNGCFIVDSIVVNEPPVLAVDLDSTDVTCFGANDGTAWATATGGAGSYTYTWSGGTPTNATGDTIGSLAPGTYTVTITDGNLCTIVDSIVINEPTLLVVDLDSTDITCNGGADGTAWVTATGGTAPYTYAWSGGTPGNSNDTIVALTAGTYAVTVTDLNGCTAVDSIVINEPAALTTVVTVGMVSCNGGADGTAYVTANGGTGAYSFVWSGGTPTNATGDTIIGLTAGTYYITVTDANNCAVVDSAVITEPTAITLDLDSTDVLCNGDATGTAWATASGGTGTLVYTWSAGTPSNATGDTIIGLSAGTYIVTVTDANLCTIVDSIVVNEPAPLATTMDSMNISCNGGADGMVWVTVTGGVDPYTYAWSGGTPGVTNDTIVNLTAGTYYVTVTDVNGCTIIDSATVIEPAALALSLDTIGVSCNAGNDGRAWGTVTGGTPGYTYTWNGGTPTNATGDTISGLTAGWYTLTVSDTNGCTIVDSIEITEPAPIVIDLDSIDVLCNGDTNGVAWVTATGGAGAYTYLWSGGTTGVTNDTIINLAAGTYIVTVTDFNGCSVVDSIVVNEPTLITLDLDSTDVLCNGDATGTAWVTATGGVGPYTYAWSGGTPGASNDTTLGLPAGTYVVTVTDANLCTAVDSIVVNEPTPLVTTMDSMNISCNGGADGMVWVTVTGGVDPYTYAWSGGTPGVTNDTIVNLTAGTYYVTVTDVNGCTIVDSATVIEPAALVLALDTIGTSCNGSADGTAWGTVTGGTPGYTYTWNGGTPTNATGDTISGLTAGWYTLTVADTNGCTIVDSIEVTEPAPIVIGLDSVDVLCNGDTNGVAWVTASGGAGGYTYAWSGGIPGVTNDTIINLAAGTYIVTVTDANLCTNVDSIVVNEPTLITLDLDSTDVLCNGDATGTAWVTATGGVGPYTYAWSAGTPGTTNDTTLGLPAGTYVVTVTDANLCTAVDSIVVNEPAPLATTMDSMNISCNGGADGMVWVTVTGGTSPYAYVWSGGTPGVTNDTIVNLTAGTYYVTVTDFNGCTIVDSATVVEPTALALTLDTVAVSCNGGADGTAWGTVTGGTPGYTYTWNGGTPTNATGDTISGLTAGWYTLTVADTNGCTIVDSIEVTEPTPLVITLDSTNILCNGDTNGVAYVTATGGTPGYTYAWSGGTPTNATGDTIINLPAGTYIVTVTDANSCETIDSVMVVEPPALVLDLDSTDVNCFGGADGTAWATASGGTGTLVYTWSAGTPTNATGDTISNLVAGTYIVTVTDDNNCSIVDSIVVNEPTAPLTISLDSTDVTCFGLTDGTAWATAAGGTPGYSYAWSGGTPTNSVGDTVGGLAAGTYIVTVTDTNGCSTVDSIVINEPTELLVSIDSVNVSCNGGNDGMAWVTATGGTVGSGYSYTWSGGTAGATPDTIVVLTAGTYYVTVTDASGCQTVDSVLIEEPTPIDIVPDSTNVSCFGGNDGKAWVTVSGGTPAAAGYTISWSGGVTTSGPQNDTATGLIAGAYTVVVSDSNGCADSVVINITEPAELIIALDSTDVNCLGGADGTASVFITGGTPGYDIVWNAGTPNTAGDTITGLIAGTYVVTVTDTNGCTATDSIVVNEPATAISFVKDSSNVNCFGGADGAAWVTATGGTPSTAGPAGYTYNWTGGGTVGAGAGDTLVGLSAGTYYVTVTDANGCELADSFLITEPLAPLSIVKDSFNVACNGDSTGKAWVTVAGGTPGYQYTWNAGTTTGAGDTITNLLAGTYRVTVTDTNSCIITALFTIEEPVVITTTIDQDNVNCFGGTDGKAWITGAGGVTPYSYAWSGGVTTSVDGDTALNLAAGTYYVTLTDDNGCTAIDSAVITEPAAPLTLVGDSLAVNCFGGNDGKAWVTPSGGTVQYSYSWSGGTSIGAGDTIINLTAGNYTVTVTDANGCTEVLTIEVTQPTAPLTSTIDAINVTCFGADDGIAWVTPAGGTPGYTYAWNGGTPSANGDTVTGLAPGNYIVTITDANGCTVTDAIGVTEPDELLLTTVVDSNTNCYGGATGGATVSLTGGTGPYDYQWSNGAGTTLASPDTFNSVASLMIGDYIVTVTDANGCETQDTVTIVERPGPQYVDAVIVSTLCNEPNGSITLNFTTSDPPLSYSWSHDTNLNSATADNLIDGTYTVTVTDGSTCDTVIQDIYVPAVDKPVLDTVIVKESFCGNDDGSITLAFTSGVPPYTYTWSHDISLNSEIASGLEPGTYEVTVADANACDTIMSFDIEELDAPELTVDPLPVQTIFRGQSLTIEASLVTPLDTVVYAWTPEEEISCTDCLDPLLSPTQTTTFLLVATDAYSGCTDTLFYTVVVKDEENIFIPNAFTPNGDGTNDVWRIRDLQYFEENELIILNRWGDEVFRAAPYQNDWDGTYNGSNLPAGTYYYILKLNTIDEAVTGPLTIIK